MVFVGPSLLESDLESLDEDDVDLRPPIRRGDLRVAADDGYTHVAIIDGEFFQSLAVSPKEILACLDSGVTVIGGASMGALRAAELYPYGMIGVGQVYRWYRSGRVTRDDDVAVTFARGGVGYVVLNVPMVNVMWVMDQAREQGWLDVATRRRVTSAARRIPWTDRTWPHICRRAALSPETTVRVMEAASRPQNNLKRLDALATVDRVRSAVTGPATASAGRSERTR